MYDAIFHSLDGQVQGINLDGPVTISLEHYRAFSSDILVRTATNLGGNNPSVKKNGAN